MNARIDIDWLPHRALYDEIQFAAPTPLEQCWNYGDAIAAVSRNEIRRAVAEIDGLPAATAQAAARRLLGPLSAVRLTRGPVVPDPAHTGGACRAFADAWPLRRGNLLFLMPNVPEAAAPGLVRPLGKRRMTTGYTTAWLDISPDPENLMGGLRGNWRTALRRVLEDPPVIRFSSRPGDLEPFIRSYLEDRRIHRYAGPDAALIRALPDAFGRDLRLYRALEHGDAVAASLFLRHGRSATYYLSWTTEKGRSLNAAHYLLWEAIRTLRDDGVRWLDLGGLDARAPGVARFKLGLGAPPETYSGTWL